MPAILTHDFFGREALSFVEERSAFKTDDERDAFLLGNQGPDPLFYLVAAPGVDKANRLGDLMHHERPVQLMLALHDAVDMVAPNERAVARAYAAGFICHYLLDSSAHPLIIGQQYALCDAGVDGLDRSAGSRVHQMMERDLDEMVLFSKTGHTVATYRPYREVLKASNDTLAVIDKVYFYTVLWAYSKALDLDAYTQAVKSFRRIQRLFWAPGRTKRALLTRVELLAKHGGYSQFEAMAHYDRAEDTSAFDNHEHAAWTNPFTGAASTESFWDLYEDAQERVFDALSLFFGPEFGEEQARQLTGGLNFSGMPVAEDEPLGSVEE